MILSRYYIKYDMENKEKYQYEELLKYKTIMIEIDRLLC